jgi:hypothetical protein
VNITIELIKRTKNVRPSSENILASTSEMAKKNIARTIEVFE